MKKVKRNNSSGLSRDRLVLKTLGEVLVRISNIEREIQTLAVQVIPQFLNERTKK